MLSRVRRRGGTGAALLTATIVTLLLAGGPAGAHPNASSTPLRAGQPATVTVLLFADEGPTTGFEVAVPPGVRLTGATADRHLPVATTRGDTVTFGGGRLVPGEFAQVRLEVVPAHGGALALRVLARLDGVGPPYVYPPVVIGAADPGAGGPGGLLVGSAVLAVGLVATTAGLARRRRRRRRLAR